MPEQVTFDVKISVESFYQSQSDFNNQGENYFAYRITIENLGEDSIQLISRHWHILDGVLGYREVEGDGVIGEQPIIEAGAMFRYVSGVNFNTSIGKMWGSYQMINIKNNKTFDVTIPDFLM